MALHNLLPTRGKLLFNSVVFFLVALLLSRNSLLWAYDMSEGIAKDFTEMSLEELINIEVVSVAKKAQRLSDTDAAVYVITQEDLKRSGVNSIPEALRMVPGVQVARADANKWFITARGFNGRFASKLLVLMDGRSVYTPIYSGVFWDMQDTMMEDIERIEIIRGPGATIWGANAVNGVINIITKRAKDSQGTLITAGAGTEERAFGSVRYGGKAGEDTHYRLYAKYLNRDSGEYPNGKNGNDDWDAYRAGFRVDWDDSLTLQGDVFTSNAGSDLSIPSLMPPYTQALKEDIDTSGGHLLGKWSKPLSNGSKLDVQIYYDRSEYKMYVADLTSDTIDFELNHQFQFGDRHDLIWGVGYRHVTTEMSSDLNIVAFNEKTRNDHLFSGFIQDAVSFLNEKLRLTIGSKFEDNDYTGFEIQPSARLLWSPEAPYSIWASVSRAVRTPSRGESDSQFDLAVLPPGSLLPAFPGAGIVRSIGSSDFESENLLAFELGFRVRPTDTLSMDIAGYYNIYDDCRAVVPGTPYLEMHTGMPVMIMPMVMSNPDEIDSYGIELTADWFVSKYWKLKGTYSYFKFEYGDIVGGREIETTSPHNQASLISFMSFPHNIEVDVWLRYVDSIKITNIDSYLTADVRLGWKINDQLEVSMVGQNLLDDGHFEYSPQFITTLPTQVERSVYGKLTWHF